ncbi:MAG: hypothetical protein HY364_01215 [Candidatus Aenigmarchaeota archaeon]|nr:hypothetical protein [Candidatus Aenigmarchaeota archaeon]
MDFRKVLEAFMSPSPAPNFGDDYTGPVTFANAYSSPGIFSDDGRREFDRAAIGLLSDPDIGIDVKYGKFLHTK